jgi:predicted glycoside hydrolase/deacetylase ChbG (UPF0249 family)
MQPAILTPTPREESQKVLHSGTLIVNADDWGRDRDNTGRILDCIRRGSVSSTSAMVFMEDSERAAALAREWSVDTGLHLNLTSAFSVPGCSSRLLEYQAKISKYLWRHRFARTLFHPGLVRSFEYVVSAQLDEYRRLYGTEPERLDGHHHMHLCANVLLAKLLPAGTVVRRNFSFQPGEKGAANRIYRKLSDRMLSKRHRSVDFFFSIEPVENSDRLGRILSFARQHVVELETHPVNPEEYRFLMGSEVSAWLGDFQIATRFVIPDRSVRNGL